MKKHPFLTPRYKVIADYPDTPFKDEQICETRKGNSSKDLIDVYNSSGNDSYVYPEDYPHLFRELEWYQERTIDDMQSIKFIQVTMYEGYWKVGDIVPVLRLQLHDQKFHAFILLHDHVAHGRFCIPITEEEYSYHKKKHDERTNR